MYIYMLAQLQNMAAVIRIRTIYSCLQSAPPPCLGKIIAPQIMKKLPVCTTIQITKQNFGQQYIDNLETIDQKLSPNHS